MKITVYLTNGDVAHHECNHTENPAGGSLVVMGFSKDFCSTYVIVAYAHGQWKTFKQEQP